MRVRRAAVRRRNGADRQPEHRRRRKHPAGGRLSARTLPSAGGGGSAHTCARTAHAWSSATSRRLPSRRPARPASRRSLIGNFTWDWIYEGYRDDAARSSSRAISGALYRDATLALRLPMSGGFEGLESITRDIPFIARRSQRDAGRRAAGARTAAARSGQAAGADVVRRLRRFAASTPLRWPA